MPTQEIDFVCEDNYSIKGKLFFDGCPEKKRIVIINPALAVPQTYYSSFAEFLAQNGFTVVTYDYRGIGDSIDPAIHGSTILMEHWGRYDFHAVIEKVLTELEPEQLYVIGHSAGGQLLGMSEHCRAIDAMVFVTTPNGYWKHYSPPFKYALALFWYVVAPVLSYKRSYFPARMIKFAPDNVPSGVIKQWADWGKSRDYLFSEKHGFDLTPYQSLTIPILAYSFTDDNFAPYPAVSALLSHYPHARIEHKSVQPSDHNRKHIGHFGFFRPSMQESLWEETLSWLSSLESINH
jgi:predicted alpha/beta hydrolase